jgi:hypothetical protein
MTTAIPLLDEFVGYIEGRVDAGLLTPDATGEFHFPGQDLATNAVHALDDLLNRARPCGATVHAVSALSTSDGFVAEIRYRTHHDGSTYQTASIVSVRDGRIDRLSQADALLASDFFETRTLTGPACTSSRSSSTPPGHSDPGRHRTPHRGVGGAARAQPRHGLG